MSQERDVYYLDKFVVYKGKKYTFREIAGMHKISCEAVYKRSCLNWTPKQMVETPKGHKPLPDDAETDEQGSKRKSIIKEFGISSDELNYIFATSLKWVKG